MNWLKRTWYLLLPIIISVVVIDWAKALLAIHALAVIALVLVFIDFLFDSANEWGLFPTLNIDKALEEACKTPISAALVWLGYLAMAIAIVLSVTGSVNAAEIPDRARQHLPTLSQAIDTHWHGAPMPEIMAGQVEQESSWKERATLKTSRELGRGLVQLTIAYNRNGSERFNAYRDSARRDTLAGWNWKADPYNPRYQLAYLVLRDRDTFKQTRLMMSDDAESWKAALVAYNAGMGRVLSRRASARVLGLSVNHWSGGLDQAHCSKENTILYGRPLWQAVNEYPAVIFRKANKYAKEF